MLVFEFCLALGLLGLTAMALFGFGGRGHTQGGAAPGGHLAGGHAHGHALPGGHAHGHALPGGRAALPGGRAALPGGPAHAGAGAHTHTTTAAKAAPSEGALASFVWSFTSPRVLFSVLFGFGLSGIVLRAWMSGWAHVAAAVAVGLAFELLVVAPLWRFLFTFASRPAETLEQALFGPARAVTGFDREGHGLVAIEVDGQVVQLLGSLGPEDRAAGVRIKAGDELRVEEVDDARNRCRVSTR